MNSAIILAAGLSTRFGDERPKQFTSLLNKKSVLDFSVKAFFNNKKINEIIIVVPKNWKKNIQKQYRNCKVVDGGVSRSESSYLGLKACSKKCKFVLIHDAARPLVTENIINECIAYLSDYDAVIPLLNINDCLILKQNNNLNYLDRKLIKLVQTPQGFQYDKIQSSYNKRTNELDDFSVLIKNKKNKFRKKFIRGSKLNFKITTENDINIAKKLANEL